MIWGFMEIHCYHYTAYFSEDGISDWSKHSLGKLLMAGFFSSIENSGILLGVFLGKKFYDAQVDLQKREKEKRDNELRLLKSQIDPHFLFNNLNTVDALIDSDPTRAKAYLHKLSKLYRYLIATKDDEVVALEDELDFAENYIYLLEQRYGDAYQFEINNPSNQSDAMIPPGALQTIFENVIKHNEGSSSKAIQTKIDIASDVITIRNNVQTKTNPIDSTGTGLKNLTARYKLLTDKPIKITKGSDYEIVIPLLNKL